MIIAKFILCMLFILASFSAAGAQRYMGLWENGVLIKAFEEGMLIRGLNDLGQVVGIKTSYTPRYSETAFFWDNNQICYLTGLGEISSRAFDINNSGQIVGNIRTIQNDSHAFLWERGNMYDLGTLGGENSYAFAINNLGQIVGMSETITGESHAVLWDKGEIIDLGVYGNDLSSMAVDINDNSKIVGLSQVSNDINHFRGVIWENKAITALSNLNNSKQSFVSAINNNGIIIGASIYLETYHAVIWENGNVKEIANFYSYYSHGLSINDNNQAVGIFDSGPGGSRYAFIYENNETRRLFDKENFSDAWLINNKGQIIARVDYATVPIPGAVLLLGVGLGGMVLYSRRKPAFRTVKHALRQKVGACLRVGSGGRDA